MGQYPELEIELKLGCQELKKQFGSIMPMSYNWGAFMPPPGQQPVTHFKSGINSIVE